MYTYSCTWLYSTDTYVISSIFIQYVGAVYNLVISVDCSLNYSHHKYNTKLYNRTKEIEYNEH